MILRAVGVLVLVSSLLACGALPGPIDAADEPAAAADVIRTDRGAFDADEPTDTIATDAARDVATTDATDAATGPPCTPDAIACADAATAAVCNASGHGWAHTTACTAGTRCELGACIGPIAWHLRNSVDLQYVQGQDPSLLAHCATLATPGLLCVVDATMHALQPRFVQWFATSWVALNAASTDPCSRPATAHACIAAKMRGLANRWLADNPHLLLSGELAEFVARANVPASQWPGVCRPGSVDIWGTDTCIPDIEHSAAARDYLVSWGQTFVDAGARAVLFGQLSRMTGTLPSGGHSVSYAGAAGFADVIGRIRAYAATRGIHTLYVGAQAATGVALRAGGPQLIDFIEGAQHLAPVGAYLLQPLSRGASFVDGGDGDGDPHEANLANDAYGLPVLLDYDNFSGDPARPDDIRRLGQVANNALRARVLTDHWNHLRLYNPRASLSIPVSKVLGNDSGVTCHGVSAYQFAAEPCGLTAAARALFLAPDGAATAPTGAASPPIRPAYWGQQLRGRDETVSWYYLAFLGRRASTGEYVGAVSGLPPLMSADSARCAFAAAFVTSPEFVARHLTDADFAAVVMRALLLRDADAGGVAFFSGELTRGVRTRSGIVEDICHSAEATALVAAPG